MVIFINKLRIKLLLMSGDIFINVVVSIKKVFDNVGFNWKWNLSILSKNVKIIKFK